MTSRPFRFGLAAIALVTAVQVAIAEPAILRTEVTVTNSIATVGDFFDNAGVHAIKPLFRSPDIGHTGTVPVWQVLERASALGMTQFDTRGMAFIDVTRASRYITGEDFLAMVRSAVAERLGSADHHNLEIEVETLPDPVHADPTARDPVIMRRLNLSTGRSGRFQAQFSVDEGDRRREVVVQGTARETRRVAVLNSPVGRGETITALDVFEMKVNAREVTDRSIVTADQIVGMQARRNLREKTVLSESDFRQPVLIERNQNITITYRAGAMVLSSQGRALQAGAKNDLINVLNLQSNRTLQARVLSPGEVLIAPRTLRLAKTEE